MKELSEKALMNLRFAAGLIASTVAELGREGAANVEIAPGLDLATLGALLDGVTPPATNPEVIGLMSISAVLRITIPVDTPDAMIKKLGAALTSSTKETVGAGVMEMPIREHLHLTDPELGKLLHGADLLITDSTHYHVE